VVRISRFALVLMIWRKVFGDPQFISDILCDTEVLTRVEIYYVGGDVHE